MLLAPSFGLLWPHEIGNYRRRALGALRTVHQSPIGNLGGATDAGRVLVPGEELPARATIKQAPRLRVSDEVLRQATDALCDDAKSPGLDRQCAVRVGWRRWTATAVGFIGVLVMVRPGQANFDTVAMVAVFAACAFALANVLILVLARTEPPNRILFYYHAGGAIVFAAPTAWAWTRPVGV